MLNTKDQKTALRLYRKYQTERAEYLALAEKYRIQITDLNRICWYLEHPNASR